MKYAFILVLMLCSFVSTTKASFWTDTHSYILNSKAGELVAIDRETGKEAIIRIGAPGSISGMAVYQEYVSPGTYNFYAYLVNKEKNQVEVLSLPTCSLIKTIPVGQMPETIQIWGGVVYVPLADSKTISMIDIFDHDKVSTLRFDGQVQSLALKGGYGYVVNLDTQTLDIFERNFLISDDYKVIKKVEVGIDPRSITIDAEGNFGYVTNYQSGTLSVVDLKTHKVVDTIQVKGAPVDMKIYEVWGKTAYGYVSHLPTGGKNIITVVNLDTRKVVKTIEVATSFNEIKLINEYGFVIDKNADKVSVIDLETNTVLATLSKPKDESIDFVKDTIYAGSKLLRPPYPRFYSDNLVQQYVDLMPKTFQVGTVEKRAFAEKPTQQTIDFVNGLARDYADKKISADKLLSHIASNRSINFGFHMIKRPNYDVDNLHLALAQAIWKGDEDVAKTMVRNLVLLNDSVITKLATVKWIEPKAVSTSSSSSTSPVVAPAVKKAAAKKAEPKKATVSKDDKKEASTKKDEKAKPNAAPKKEQKVVFEEDKIVRAPTATSSSSSTSPAVAPAVRKSEVKKAEPKKATVSKDDKKEDSTKKDVKAKPNAAPKKEQKVVFEEDKIVRAPTATSSSSSTTPAATPPVKKAEPKKAPVSKVDKKQASTKKDEKAKPKKAAEKKEITFTEDKVIQAAASTSSSSSTTPAATPPVKKAEPKKAAVSKDKKAKPKAEPKKDKNKK